MEYDNLMMKNVSYLRARDPSILSFNRANMSGVKTNLLEEFKDITPEELKEEKEHILVYLRIKTGYNFADLYEINGNTLTSKIPPGSNFLRNVRDGDCMKKIYNFTNIFEPQMTQAEIFNYVVKPKLLDFINGQNSTLLTYGASGSGKTFTVIGTVEEPGLVPRSLEYLFKTLPLSGSPTAKPLATGEVKLLNDTERKREKLLCRSLLNASWTSSSIDRSQHLKTYMAMQQRLTTEPAAELEDFRNLSVGVWVSFAEIYNEHIYDLLQMGPSRGQARPKLRLGANNGHTYIKNITHINVTSGQEAYQILQYGIHNLNYASTKLNDHSSRSHSIFSVKLVQVSKADGGCYVSCFNFCDLAGSERSKKTNNVGDRLKESNNINSSLLVLGRCISAVRNIQKQTDRRLVPFRESKLTQLFQKALLGEEHITMIVNISPSREMFDESQHVLNFSAIAQEIILERKPEIKKHNRFSMLVETESDSSDSDYYRSVVLQLQEELEVQKSEYEVNQKMNLHYVVEEYDKILKSQKKEFKELMAKVELSIKTKYETKMENMKIKYEQIIESLRKPDVIEIVSSGEDSDEENQEKQTEIGVLTETVVQACNEYKELREKYNQLQDENLKLKAKNMELKQKLEENIEINIMLDNKSVSSEQEDYDADIY